jgi:hypothetical protein
VETAAFVIAVIGLALAALSLGWQLASFLLTGPRVKVRLREGVRSPLTGAAMIGPLSMYTERGREALEARGQTQHVLIVTVTNTGRVPTTVDGWSVSFGNRVEYSGPPGDPAAPPLPCRLEPHAGEHWCAPIDDDLRPVLDDFVDQSDAARTARAHARLQTGAEVSSRERIVLARDGTIRVEEPLLGSLWRRLRRSSR